MIALLFKCTPVSEIHICRKNYLDGSVPPGFQRTALIGYKGRLPLKEKEIEITWVYLEEDAGRKSDKTAGKDIFFRLDRLGVPLVEIVTAPECYTPQEIVEAAKQLGMLLKSCGLVRRGLGAIRQDINVSIKDGARVELKGVQLLDMIPVAADMEIRRQIALLEIRDELKKRGFRDGEVKDAPIDVTKLLKKTKVKFINKALKTGQKAYMLILPKFKGLVGKEVQPNRRFGTELSDKVKAFTSLRGLIHSDEDLKKYGFSKDEIATLTSKLPNPDIDAFVLVVGPAKECLKALRFVTERANYAIIGVPEETRHVKDDGTSVFLRELHGRSRLYPDTDSLPLVIEESLINKLKENLPPYPWEIMEYLAEKYQLKPLVTEQLTFSGRHQLFEELVKMGIDKKLAANTLTQTFAALENEKIDVQSLTPQEILEIFKYFKDGRFSKEAIPEVLAGKVKHRELQIPELLEKLGLKTIDTSELDALIERILEEKDDFIKQKGMDAFKPLMGVVMKEVRGKIDGKVVSQRLKDKLQNYIASAS